MPIQLMSPSESIKCNWLNQRWLFLACSVDFSEVIQLKWIRQHNEAYQIKWASLTLNQVAISCVYECKKCSSFASNVQWFKVHSKMICTQIHHNVEQAQTNKSSPITWCNWIDLRLPLKSNYSNNIHCMFPHFGKLKCIRFHQSHTPTHKLGDFIFLVFTYIQLHCLQRYVCEYSQSLCICLRREWVSVRVLRLYSSKWVFCTTKTKQ